MKCEWVRQNIVLHVYGELADDARHELEQHVARCADCAAELKAEQEFHALLSQDRAAEPTPNLLAASRMRLQEALETAEQGRFWHRLAFDPAQLAAAGEVLARAGFGDSDSGFCRRSGNDLQDLRPPASDTGYNGNYGSSHRSLHRRHRIHHAGSGHQPDQHQVQHGFVTANSGIAERTSASSSFCCTPRAITTTPACAWIRSIC